MTSVYTPTATWHATITEIDDNDSPTAANLNTAMEAVADNAAFLFNSTTNIKSQFITTVGDTSKTFATDVVLLAYGCGGGGGGGSGSTGIGNSTSVETYAGGGGGAGARSATYVVKLTAGTYLFHVGDGGTSDNDGGDSYIYNSLPVKFAIWKGGQCGASASSVTVCATAHTQYVLGGNGPGGHASERPDAIAPTTASGIPILPVTYGSGGAGTGCPDATPPTGLTGNFCVGGGDGGVGGTHGTTSGGSRVGGGGGGGGGGGAAGEFNIGTTGGAGGHGGNGNDSGVSTGANGGAGVSATGGGGGGGGSAGACTTTPGVPGTGGKGGSGSILMFWVEIGVHP